MEMKFDKKTVLDNISFLIHEKNYKIGEFEKLTGVNAGYISRTMKDPNAKPSIEFLVNAANELDIPMDILLFVPLNSPTEYERYISKFFSKVYTDTINSSSTILEWERVTLKDLADDTNFTSSSDFSFIKSFEESGQSSNDSQTRKLFIFSKAFNQYAEINHDYFIAELSHLSYLYLISISNPNNEHSETVIEAWISTQNPSGYECLATSKSSPSLSSLLSSIFSAADLDTKQTKLSAQTKSILDLYMNDTYELVDPDNLPF